MKAKQLFHTLAAVLSVMLSVSCSDGGKYVDYEGTVAYSYWTFSFGTVYDKLPEVDPSTFKSVNDWLGHDAKHCYFKGILIRDADVSTFEAGKYPLCRDRKDFYYMGKPMNVADISSFKILMHNEDDVWCMDSRYAYYDTTRVEADLATFKVTGANVAIDKNNVYRYGKILPLADPATYQENWRGFYSRDKSHIWYLGDLMEDVDYATFKVDKNCFDSASDKYGAFQGKERVNEQSETADTVEPDSVVEE